jgi:hypothetical protein
MINILYSPTKFRITSVKPYYTKQKQVKEPAPSPQVIEKKKSESRDKNTIRIKVPNNFNLQCYYIYPAEHEPLDSNINTALQNAMELSMFLTSKKELDFELSLKLYKESCIIIPSKPFEVLQKQKIKGLITRGMFSFE